MPPTENRPRVGDLPALPLPEIAKLPPDVLAILQDEIDAELKAVKEISARFERALGLRYGEPAAATRQAEGKPTGTVRLADGDVTVVADLPKRVAWDQDALAAMIARIRAAGADPAEYVETSYRVSERRYAAWPESIRADFTAARTVRIGKPSFRLVTGEAC